MQQEDCFHSPLTGDSKSTLQSLSRRKIEKRKYLFVSKYVVGGNFPKLVVGDEQGREVSLTNYDYHRPPSHCPAIQKKFISVQPWNSPYYLLLISQLSFNSKFKKFCHPIYQQVLPVLMFSSGSCIKVPRSGLLIFCTKSRPVLKLSTFTSHPHTTPITIFKVVTSSPVNPTSKLHLQPVHFPQPHSDSPYFQAPSFLMLPMATAANLISSLPS